MTILYINGDGHSAGVQTATSFLRANDDIKFSHRGRGPHPEDLKNSYGSAVASIIKARHFNEAEYLSSNHRILRNVREYLEKPLTEQLIVIIGWTDWSSQEWEHEGIKYQVSARKEEPLPEVLGDQYREWIKGVDTRAGSDQDEIHEQIWKLHEELKEKKIRHFFFNTEQPFDQIKTKHKWGYNYLDPYTVDTTMVNVLKSNGFLPNKYGHFDSNAHFFWAQYLINHLRRIL